MSILSPDVVPLMHYDNSLTNSIFKGSIVRARVHVCVRAHLSTHAQGGQKRVRDPPELGLQRAVSYLTVDTGNQTLVL